MQVQKIKFMIPNICNITKSFVLSLFVLILLTLLFLPSNLFAQGKSKYTFKKLLLAEIGKHPHSKVEDIYKFIHQAAFGSEHAVKDTASC